MPVLSKLLRRIEEIDTELEALHKPVVLCCRPWRSPPPTQLLLVSHPSPWPLGQL
ncbi:hypothetical protein NZK33_03320 [Cyanobium sp. FGCU-6]|nr:hypothetical protein [Cyanobium sp. FGCU6]